MQYCFTIKELGSAEIDPHCPVLIYFCMDVVSVKHGVG